MQHVKFWRRPLVVAAFVTLCSGSIAAQAAQADPVPGPVDPSAIQYFSTPQPVTLPGVSGVPASPTAQATLAQIASSFSPTAASARHAARRHRARRVARKTASSTAYFVHNDNSSLCLDVWAASKNNGANVDQYTCLGDHLNQEWIIDQIGTYQGLAVDLFINNNSGKVLDVYARSKSDGANVDQWDWNQGTNQEWIDEETTNRFLQNVNSSKVLDVYARSTQSGANVDQWTFNGGSNQLWFYLNP